MFRRHKYGIISQVCRREFSMKAALDISQIMCNRISLLLSTKKARKINVYVNVIWKMDSYRITNCKKTRYSIKWQIIVRAQSVVKFKTKESRKKHNRMVQCYCICSLNHLWEKCQIPYILQLCKIMDYGSRNILSFAPVYHCIELLSIIHFLKTILIKNDWNNFSKTSVINFESTVCNQIINIKLIRYKTLYAFHT